MEVVKYSLKYLQIIKRSVPRDKTIIYESIPVFYEISLEVFAKVFSDLWL